MRTLLSILTFTLLVTFTKAQPQWNQRHNVDTVHRYDGTGFAIGNNGYIGIGGAYGNTLSDFWKYNRSNDSWTKINDFPGDGKLGTISFVIGGKAYVGTGSLGVTVFSGLSNELWCYDTLSGNWSQKASMPSAAGTRYGADCFVLGSKAYVIAGSTGGPPYLSDVWEYDAVNDSWSQKNNVPAGLAYRSGGVGFTSGGIGYVEGGLYNNGSTNSYPHDLWKYNAINDSWISLGTIPGSGRYRESVFVIKGIPIYGGGYEEPSGYDLVDFWKMDTTTYQWTSLPDFTGTGRFDASSFTIGNSGYIGTGATQYPVTGCLNDFWQLRLSIVSFTSSSSSLCPGDSTQFNGQYTGKAKTWNWSFSGGSPSTSKVQNPTVTYTTPGKYTVKLVITDSLGTDSVTSTNYITVITPPSPVITNNDTSTTFCQNIGSLKSNYVQKNQWYLNGSRISGDTTQNVFPATSGFYSVIVTSPQGCSATSEIFSVTVLPAPSAGISTLTNSICSGSTATLHGSGKGTYAWSTKQSSDSIVVSPLNNSTYTLTVTGNNGCYASATQVITVNLLPVTPIIEQNGNLLASSVSKGNQWNFNGNPIVEATNQFYTPTADGFYSVTVMGTDGCSATSNILSFTTTGILSTLQNISLSIYPNPSNGQLSVDLDSAVNEDITLRIYNTVGELVYSKIIAHGNRLLTLDITGSISSGIYSLVLQGNSGTKVQKVIISK